jgi:hypothetical protein
MNLQNIVRRPLLRGIPQVKTWFLEAAVQELVFTFYLLKKARGTLAHKPAPWRIASYQRRDVIGILASPEVLRDMIGPLTVELVEITLHEEPPWAARPLHQPVE